jgi:tetratricopeptide (TPR) repeat protein
VILRAGVGLGALALASGCAQLASLTEGIGGEPEPAAEPSYRVVPVSPEAEAGAAFMRGRALELDGRLLEAAEAYEHAARLDPDSAALQRSLAQVWIAAGEPKRALGYAERALELDPDDEELRTNVATLHVRMQQYDRAIELLEPLFQAGKLEDEGSFTLFTLYLNLDRVDGAKQVAQKLIAKSPEDVRGYLALGAVHEREEKPVLAEKIYRAGLLVEPEQPALYDAIARLRRTQKDSKGELVVLREKLEILPGDPAALMRIAQIHEDAGQRAEATRALEELAAEHPELAGPQFRLGLFYYEAGRYDDAIARFQSVARSGGGAADQERYQNEVRYFIGLVHEEAGRTDEALAELEQVPPTSPRFADARTAMARIWERRKDWDRTTAELTAAIRAAPDKLSLQVYLAGVQQRRGDLPGAVALMQELIRENPDKAELYYDLGVLYGEAGDRDRSLEQMHKVLEIEPDNASALNYIGYTWAEQGLRLDEAESLIRRAIALKPEDGYITDSLGWLFYQRGLQQQAAGQGDAAKSSFNAARTQLEHALELLEKDDPVITWHLGDTYRSLARYEDALATYKRALALEPEDDDAAKIQAEIDRLQQKLGGAKREGAR